MKLYPPRTPSHLLWLAALLFFAARGADAQPSTANSGQVTKDAKIADPAYLSQETLRFQEFLRQMPAVLDSDAAPVSKELAVDAIREFRYAEGIPALVKNLVTVRKTVRFGSDMVPYISSYACALALCEFGQASVEPLLSLIGQSHDRLEIEVAAHTILDILGAEKAIQQLSIALTSADYPEQKKNFDDAIAVVRTSDSK